MTTPDHIAQTLVETLAERAFSNRASVVNLFVAAPGHGSLRGRNNSPQHLVRTTGTAMSTYDNALQTQTGGQLRDLASRAAMAASFNPTDSARADNACLMTFPSEATKIGLPQVSWNSHWRRKGRIGNMRTGVGRV